MLSGIWEELYTSYGTGTVSAILCAAWKGAVFESKWSGL